MLSTVELHLFTNSTISAPSTQMIERTYASFIKQFGAVGKVSVWCDTHPNIEQSQAYIENLKKIFAQTHQTQSLSDGYVQAIQQSNSEFLFMLEHDWEFIDGITHKLNTILDVMREQKILHMRFNKRANIAKKSDRDLQQISHAVMPYCTTKFLSNNPHIINREDYIQRALPLIHVREKSFGIEKDLSVADLLGAIYGPKDHPATVCHIDGKTFRPT